MKLVPALWISIALMVTGAAAIFLWSAPRIDAGGLAPFDTRSAGYGYDDAVAFLAALSPEGRAAYLGPQRLADTVFPIGLLGTLALGTLLALRGWSLRLALALTLIPLGYFVFDMLENAAVAGMLRAGAEGIAPEDVAWASLCTRWKFALVNTALLVLGLAWLARGVDRLRRDRGL